MVRVRPEKRKTSPPPAVPPSQATAVAAELLPRAASARGGDGEDAAALIRVRRSSVAPRVTCGLCGRILRDATTVSECLHSFCRKCICRKFEEDEDIKYCPTCNTNLGCSPLFRLRSCRSDHNLQCISTVLFPAKKRKVEEISPLHAALASLPSPSNGIDVDDNSAKETGAYLLAESMSTKIETEPSEKVGMEHYVSTTKPSALSLDRFRHLPATSTMVQEGNEVEEEEIAPDHPVLASFDKGDTKKLTLISEKAFGVLNCDFRYRKSTPLDLPPLSRTRSDPPLPSRTSVPSNETQNMNVEVEVVKEIPSFQGWNHDFCVLCNDSYMAQSQIYKEVAILKEELQNAISEKNEALERTRVLEEALKEQSERLQIESERSQVIEAAREQMVREYRELARLKQFEMFEKDAELSSLKHNRTMIEKRNIEVEQRNAALVDQIDYVNRLLEAEKLNSIKLTEQLGQAVNENNKLMTELKTFNDALARIKGVIHAGLTATPYQLDKRREGQAERRHSVYNCSQGTEATLSELLREYGPQKSEVSDKDEVLASLKHNIIMIGEESIEANQRNAVLEDRISHASRLLEAQKQSSSQSNELLEKLVNEMNKIMTKLKTYNDGLDIIQGCIRRSLTNRISRLRQTSTMINVGHYEDLLARINALGPVMAHLPKTLETIEIAASLSAYSAAASIFIRLRAYHGENFDLQRLLLPLHFNRQDYARIWNAVDPLAAQVAQKYEVCKH